MGRSRGGLTTKIHALTDAHGLPLELVLTPGQAGDCPVAEQLLGHIPSCLPTRLTTPTGCAAKSKPPVPHPTSRRWCISDGNLLQPSALPRTQPHRTVLQPHQHFRRLATRYEKHAANFLAMLKLAAVHLWLRHNESVT